MGFRINTNTASLQAQSSLNKVNHDSQSSFAKLSSGQRITKASDDAAGLAISEKMKAEIRSARQADRNANDAISLVQVAEGSLSETSNIMVRMRELAVQSASDTLGDNERAMSNLEYQSLKQEVERISQVTEFNGKKLLAGTGETYEFQVGTGSDSFKDRISFDTKNLESGLGALEIEKLDVGSKKGAQASLESIDKAIDKVAGNRAALGAIQNRLISTSNNIQTYTENMSAANSRIRDVDYAEETAKQAKNQILMAAGTSVLAQANMSGQAALKLIG
jgi:flagellin